MNNRLWKTTTTKMHLMKIETSNKCPNRSAFFLNSFSLMKPCNIVESKYISFRWIQRILEKSTLQGNIFIHRKRGQRCHLRIQYVQRMKNRGWIIYWMIHCDSAKDKFSIWKVCVRMNVKQHFWMSLSTHTHSTHHERQEKGQLHVNY